MSHYVSCHGVSFMAAQQTALSNADQFRNRAQYDVNLEDVAEIAA